MALSNRPAFTKLQIARDEEIKKAARDATHEVGPRVYHITGIPEGPIKLLAMGCQGEGNDAQRQTAALMNTVVEEMLARGETPPTLAIYAGDNLYDRGTDTPLDTKFNTHHQNIYYNSELKALNKIPSAVILGNHDGNYDTIATLPGALYLMNQGEVVEVNQTARNYLDNSADQDDIEAMFKLREEMIAVRKNLFMQAEIPISALSHWVMPYFFYSFILNDTQIFFLNTNNLVKHFIASATKDAASIQNRPNQFEWFVKESQAAAIANRQIFIVQHIPEVVCGKRSFPGKFDSGHFLTTQEIDAANVALKKIDPNHVRTHSYNDLLVSIMRLAKVKPHLFICAHEHFLSWLNEYKLADGTQLAPQLTVGGGGGKLQHRESFRNHPYVGMQQAHYGFGLIECNYLNKSFIVDVFSVTGLRMRFTEKSYTPLIQVLPDDMNALELHYAVHDACDDYMTRLKIKEVPLASSGFFSKAFGAAAYGAGAVAGLIMSDEEKHKRAHEIDWLQDIHAYFHQRTLPDYQSGINYLTTACKALPILSSNHLPITFISVLETHLKKRLPESWLAITEVETPEPPPAVIVMN